MLDMKVSRRDEVGCWFFAIDRFDAGDFDPLLSPDERQRAERFVFDQDRLAFTICRGLLRTLVAIQIDCEPASLRFEFGPAGKPGLSAEKGKNAHFNISHSHGFGLIAIARAGPIGVDLEAIRPMPDLETLVGAHFAPEEQLEFATLPPCSKLPAFFKGWTRKEAFIKATGEGLDRDLSSFAIGIAPGAVRLLRLDDEPQAASRWNFSDLDLGPDFSATLAVLGFRPKIRFHILQPEGPDGEMFPLVSGARSTFRGQVPGKHFMPFGARRNLVRNWALA